MLTAAAWPQAVAARGSANIAALQVALRAQRLYAGPVDGVDGPGTAAAVRRLQRHSGLEVDAVAGPMTLRGKLGRRGRPAVGSRTVGPGDRGWDVGACSSCSPGAAFLPGRSTAASESTPRQRSSATSAGQACPPTDAPDPPRCALWSGPAAGARRGCLPGGRRSRRPVRPTRRSLSQRIDLLAAAAHRYGAAGAGTVRFAGWDSGGYGNLVVIDHANGVSSWYAHLSRIDVTSGTTVTTATQVGLVGATGNATGPHLHFEVRLRGAVTDPVAALR